MKNEYAILIVSCDKYRDLWDPFFQCFWKQWKNCPFPVYLQTNEIPYLGKHKGKAINLLTGKDEDWSTSLKRTLRQIPEKYVFMWNEDLFLSAPVSSKLFRKYFDLLKRKKGKHIHYRCIPPADSYEENRQLGVYLRRMPYRSIVMGFWDSSYLYSLLLTGESPWQFEIMGSYRTSYDDGFYCATQPIIEFAHMAEKGRWQHAGVEYCRNNNIAIDLSARPQGKANYIKSDLIKFYFNGILKIPWQWRLTVMDILRKIFVTY